MAEPNVMFHQMTPDTSYVEIFFLRVYLQNWLRYHHSKFQFCLLPSAIKFWAMTTKLDSRKAQVMSYVSWKFERNRRSTYWDTALWTGQGWCRLLVITGVGLLTHWTFVFARLARIVLTAKRSNPRTPRLLQNVPWTFRNLLHLVSWSKNAYFLGLGVGYDISGRRFSTPE